MVDVEVLAAADVEGDAGATQSWMSDHVIIAKAICGAVKSSLELLDVRRWGHRVFSEEIELVLGDVEQET